jgi:hypothetical protein
MGPLPLPEPAPPPTIAARRFRAAVFAADRNRAYFADHEYFDAEQARWEDATAEVGGDVRVVVDAAGLRALAPDEVLIVAEAPCLSTAMPTISASRQPSAANTSTITDSVANMSFLISCCALSFAVAP